MGANKIYIPTFISSVNYEAARVLPHVYFYNGLKQSERYFIQSGSSFVSQSAFPYFDNYSGETTTTASLSLLFNNETAPYGDIPTSSLYTQYWEDYVNLLYNPRTRILNASAIIPLAAYSDMNLNDVVQFRGNLYHLRAINDYSLTTGECTLQLLGPLENNKVSEPVYSYCLGFSGTECLYACIDAANCTTSTTTTTSGPTTTTTTLRRTTTTAAPTTTTTSGPTTTTTAGPTTTTTRASTTTTTTTTLAPTTTTTTLARTTTTTTANPNSNCLYYTIFNTTGFQRNYVFKDCADCIGPKLGIVQPNATVYKCAVSGSIYNETNGLIITAGAICGNGCPTTTTTTGGPTTTTTRASTTTIAPTTTTTIASTTTTTVPIPPYPTTTTSGPTTTTTTIGIYYNVRRCDNPAITYVVAWNGVGIVPGILAAYKLYDPIYPMIFNGVDCWELTGITGTLPTYTVSFGTAYENCAVCAGTTTTTTTTAGPTTTTTTGCAGCGVYSLAKENVGSASGIGTYKDCNGCIQTISVASQQERFFSAIGNYPITWTGGLRLRTYGDSTYQGTLDGCAPILNSCQTQEIEVSDPGYGIFYISYISPDNCSCQQFVTDTPQTITIVSGSFAGPGNMTPGAINPTGSLCCNTTTTTSTSTTSTSTTSTTSTTTTTTAGPTTTTTTGGIFCDCNQYRIGKQTGGVNFYTYRQCGTNIEISGTINSPATYIDVCAITGTADGYTVSLLGPCTNPAICPTTTTTTTLAL